MNWTRVYRRNDVLGSRRLGMFGGKNTGDTQGLAADLPDWICECRRPSEVRTFKESREGWRRPLPCIRSFSPPTIPNLHQSGDAPIGREGFSLLGFS